MNPATNPAFWVPAEQVEGGNTAAGILFVIMALVILLAAVWMIWDTWNY